jgi:metallo-beta-lactamase class B
LKKLITTMVLAAIASVAGAAEHSDDWNGAQKPFRIYGDTYYVGTAGISAVLITSPKGLILIDGATEKGGPVVADNIRALGYKLKDVKYILSSHAHHDHAGGIALLQKLSGATVLAGAGNVETLRTGVTPKEDPQFGTLDQFPSVAKVRAAADGEVVKLGTLAVTAHSTPGHTPGGTTWSWQSCEAGQCKTVVFADSLTAISADGYRFTDHPELVAQFRSSFAAVEGMACDIAIAAHPGVNDLWGSQERAAKEGNAAYISTNGCKSIVKAARERLDTRLASEKR